MLKYHLPDMSFTFLTSPDDKTASTISGLSLKGSILNVSMIWGTIFKIPC